MTEEVLGSIIWTYLFFFFDSSDFDLGRQDNVLCGSCFELVELCFKS